MNACATQGAETNTGAWQETGAMPCVAHAFPRVGEGGGVSLYVTIPNLITIGRLCLVPLIVWLILAPHPLGAFLVFVVAAASDAVDGFLARQLNLRSDLGAYLDPIADKLLMMSSYLFLAVPSFPAAIKVPVWLAMLVISRDLLLMTVGLLMILSSGVRQFPPTWLGKVTTVTLISSER